MGQRLQVYVRMHNPVLALIEKQKSLKKFPVTKEEIESLTKQIHEYKKAFGIGSSTVLAYHTQWCYGRAALIATHNILNASANAGEYNNPFNKKTSLEGSDLLSAITHLLSWYTCKLSQLIGRTGLENFYLLNFTDPEIRLNPLRAENNDGIIVIDTIKNAYCLMNLGTGDSTVSQLCLLQPIPAENYVRVYYPQCIGDTTTARIPEGAQEKETFFKNNTRINNLFIKPFKQFRLLTLSEVKRIFPDCYKETTANYENHE